MAIGCTAILCGALNQCSQARLEEKHLKEINEQKLALINECSKDKELTKEVSNEVFKQIDDLNGQLAGAKLRTSRSIPCTMPLAISANRVDGSTGRHQQDSGNGINVDELWNQSRRTEKDRIKVLGWQKFITKVWENNSCGKP